MSRVCAFAAAVSILGGCAPAMPAGAPGAVPEIAGLTAGAPQNCVGIDSSASLRIADAATLVYSSGSTVWLNRLATQCRGVRPSDILVANPGGSQYCRGDIMRTMDQVSNIPGPACVLGDFVPYRR
jgi:hypothetical protein